MKLIYEGVNKVIKGLDFLAGIILLAVLVLVVGNIILRFCGYPQNYAYDWVGFLTASAISFAISFCAARGGHVAVTILTDKLSRKAGRMIEVIISAFSAGFLLMIVRMLFLYGSRLYNGGYVGNTSKMPLYYFAFIIAVGFLGYCFVMLFNLYGGKSK